MYLYAYRRVDIDTGTDTILPQLPATWHRLELAEVPDAEEVLGRYAGHRHRPVGLGVWPCNVWGSLRSTKNTNILLKST